jgi:hypothetical protein
VTPQEVRVGMRKRVGEHHRIAERRGLVGRVVGCYGGDDYEDVRFSDGRHRLFCPQDLEEISSPQPSWWLTNVREVRFSEVIGLSEVNGIFIAYSSALLPLGTLRP